MSRWNLRQKRNASNNESTVTIVNAKRPRTTRTGVANDILTIGVSCHTSKESDNYKICELKASGDIGDSALNMGEQENTRNDRDVAMVDADNNNCIAKIVNDESKVTESSDVIMLADFVPVDAIGSPIPELFNEKFPKAKPLNCDDPESFRCQWCVRDRSEINKGIYQDVSHLINHFHRKHSQIPIRDYNVQCKECNAYFYHASRLEMHIKNGGCIVYNSQKEMYHGRPLTLEYETQMCNLCDMVFLSQKRHKKHLITNSDGDSGDIIHGCKFEDVDHPREMGVYDYIKCRFCETNFLFENDYRFHLKPWNQMHRPNAKVMRMVELFKCKTVSKPIYTCTLCLQCYKSESLFKQHISGDHRIDEFGIKCDRCNTNFTSTDDLDKHIEVNQYYVHCVDFDKCRTIPRKDTPLISSRGAPWNCCPYCPSKFPRNITRLERHISKYHQDCRKDFECPDCKMKFLAQHHFDDHMTKWKCPFCETLFPMKRLLSAHCRLRHYINKQGPKSEDLTNRPYCDICDIKFKYAHILKEHNQKQHSWLQVCPFCGDTGGTNMLKHIYSSHAYKKPPDQLFVCDMCENKVSFRDQWRLDRHVSQVHNKKEQTACDICNKTFAQKASMMRHRRIHLDIKPFKCGICELSFTQKTAMKSHKETHYNEDGLLRTAEEIKTQVEMIKLHRSGDVKSETSTAVAGVKKRSKKKKLPCKKCGQSFASIKQYKSHHCENSTDTEDSTGKMIQQYELQCDKCDKLFNSEERQKSHRCSKSKEIKGEEKINEMDDISFSVNEAKRGSDSNKVNNSKEFCTKRQYDFRRLTTKGNSSY